jgi:hypothetical protein
LIAPNGTSKRNSLLSLNKTMGIVKHAPAVWVFDKPQETMLLLLVVLGRLRKIAVRMEKIPNPLWLCLVVVHYW